MGYYVEAYIVIKQKELYKLEQDLIECVADPDISPYKQDKLKLFACGKSYYLEEFIDNIQKLDYYEMYVLGEDVGDIQFYAGENCDYDLNIERKVTWN